MSTRLTIATIWFVMWMMTWPALLADMQSIGSRRFADNNYRSELGVCMFFALLPPIWFVAPFASGFYEHGYQIGRRTAP